LKEWKCILASNQEDVHKTIRKWAKKGWQLQSCTITGTTGAIVSTNYYLFFERTTQKKQTPVIQQANVDLKRSGRSLPAYETISNYQQE